MAHHPLAGHVLPLRPTSVLFNMDLKLQLGVVIWTRGGKVE